MELCSKFTLLSPGGRQVGRTDGLRLRKTAAPRKPSVRCSPVPGPIQQNTIVSSPLPSAPCWARSRGFSGEALEPGGSCWGSEPGRLPPTEALCRRRTGSQAALQPALPEMDSRQAVWMDTTTLRRTGLQMERGGRLGWCTVSSVMALPPCLPREPGVPVTLLSSVN